MGFCVQKIVSGYVYSLVLYSNLNSMDVALHKTRRCVNASAIMTRSLMLAIAAFWLGGAGAAEHRTDFTAGLGLEGWTISEGTYVSPTYSNAVNRITLQYECERASAKGTIYAQSEQGEVQVAMFTAASSAATFDFLEWMDFRVFRVVVEDGLQLKSFEAVVPAVRFKACPISTLTGLVYTQNFDSLAELTATTGTKEWQNLVTLPYWQAWQDNDAVVSFNYNGGKASTAGFYALAADRSDLKRSFGVRTKQDVVMSWGMAFTNDTDTAMTLQNVSYLEQQWGFANTNEQAFTCSWLVTNRFDNAVNFPEGWNNCHEAFAGIYGKEETHPVPVETPVTYSPSDDIHIKPGEVLYLKWMFYPPAKGSSALVAIDNLTVTFKSVAHPMLIRIVSNVRQH